LTEATGVTVADHATARHDRRKADADHERRDEETISEIANALQTVDLLSTRLRQNLDESTQQAAQELDWHPAFTSLR
jgi:hypothetical protein